MCWCNCLYTWYYNIHFTWFKWFKNLPAIWVVSNSVWVSAVILLGMFIYYWNNKRTSPHMYLWGEVRKN
ncbi:hypothetical protein [Spiroplasma ixodetis]|uniref:hypothetical protein n=1 Tax=Spiroplasma ixodetis TaxID=2141 RepID=UPI0025759298|nr:hypothetical protein [Spiroplasma ixodetis]